LLALEQEKETFQKEELDYKAKLLQLENEKMEWFKENVYMVNKVMVLSPAIGTGSTTEDIVQAMSQASLKEGEIKGLKETWRNWSKKCTQRMKRYPKFKRKR
jgi:ribose 5-phosphate isomerase